MKPRFIFLLFAASIFIMSCSTSNDLGGGSTTKNKPNYSSMYMNDGSATLIKMKDNNGIWECQTGNYGLIVCVFCLTSMPQEGDTYFGKDDSITGSVSYPVSNALMKKLLFPKDFTSIVWLGVNGTTGSVTVQFDDRNLTVSIK